MNKEWKDWFILNRLEEQTRVERKDRKYEHTTLSIKDVPFHEELKKYIFSLSNLTKGTQYNYYHIHTWKEGDFFNEHVDNNNKRVWSYVCELKESECKTSLLVEGKKTKEGIFDCNTKHEIPIVTKGTRISLTVFGSPFKNFI